MQRLKRTLSIVLAVMLVLALATTAFAAETGSITVKNAETDRTYDLYKVFDLTYSQNGDSVAAAYTIAPAWEAFFASDPGTGYIVDTKPEGVELSQITITTSSGKVTKYINITDSNVAQFAQDALAYAGSRTADETATPSTDGDYTFSGLDLGYYLVYPQGATEIGSNYASICSLTSTVPNGEVNIKSTYPDITKSMSQKNRNDLPDNTTVTSANVGDTVTYTVKGKVPDMTGFDSYTYKLIDTMSEGLSFNNDVSIKINNIEIDTTDFTVESVTNENNSVTTTINFTNFIQHKDLVGTDIVVTYSVVVDQDAIKDISSEFNTVHLEYSNDPENPDVLGETPERRTDVYTTDLILTKVDGSDTSKTLTGAKFSIEGQSRKIVIVNSEIYKENANGDYYRLKNGQYTTTAPGEGTQDQYDSTSVKYERVTVVDKTNQNETFVKEGWVGDDGKMSFNGLGEGTYVITELVSPKGYNLLTSPITVVVSFDNETKAFSATVNGNDATVASGQVTFNVNNNSGTVLPGTGGIGTTIFYILGGILVVSAAVVLITRKRMSKEA